MFRFLAAAATEFLYAMVRRWTTLRNVARLRCKIAEDLPCGEVMKRIAALVLLLASSVAWAMPGKTERTNIGENGREARKAARFMTIMVAPKARAVKASGNATAEPSPVGAARLSRGIAGYRDWSVREPPTKRRSRRNPGRSASRSWRLNPLASSASDGSDLSPLKSERRVSTSS